jgi:hypothetical protein
VNISFCMLGLFLIFIGVNLYLGARRARKIDQIRESWPTAKGTILSIQVASEQPISPSGKTKEPQFNITANYQFRAGGQLRFGSILTYPRHFFLKKDMDRIQEQYKKGTTVDVHYDLENPQDCFLEFERSAKYYRTSIFLMVLGGILAILNILFFII